MTKPVHSLILIPWHIGSREDLTLGAIVAVRRLRCFVVEDEASCRRELRDLRVDASNKKFLTVPERPAPAFLKEVLGLLRGEDVGMIASAGTPCFVDPGAWLIGELRERGIPIRARGGASSLAALLSLSGYDWIASPRSFSFVFYDRPRRNPEFRAILGRREPVVVFLERAHFADCLGAVAKACPRRNVSVFFDLTKPRGPKHPYADLVRTMLPGEWLKVSSRFDWGRVDDVALLLHGRA
jgi:16S rRNA C1402 (ribose-2'-O) methylase RsmI